MKAQTEYNIFIKIPYSSKKKITVVFNEYTFIKKKKKLIS